MNTLTFESMLNHGIIFLKIFEQKLNSTLELSFGIVICCVFSILYIEHYLSFDVRFDFLKDPNEAGLLTKVWDDYVQLSDIVSSHKEMTTVFLSWL